MKFFSMLIINLYLFTPLIYANQIEYAKATIINNQNNVIGEAHFKQGTEGVLMNLTLRGLPPGKHGMHFHVNGNCEDYKEFKGAGGHIMPSGKPHGYLNPKGPHEGNLPNLIVHRDGTANLELYTTLVSLDGRHHTPSLLKNGGTSLIIHAHKDDHISQPIGGSGARIACGVIKSNN